MEPKYTSKIGEIKDNQIIDENGKNYRVYDCKLILILNDIKVNGQEHNGKCLLIPFDEEDERFVSDDRFRHREYLLNVLKRYEFEEPYNTTLKHTLERIENGTSNDYNEIINVLVKMGMVVFSNLDYSPDEPPFKNGAFYIPNENKSCVNEQIRKMVPLLTKERYFIGVFQLDEDGTLNCKTKGLPKDIIPAIEEIYENSKKTEDER